MRNFKISSRTGWVAVGFILLLSFVLMLRTSQSDSIIMDELAHIPAGYSYVKFFDFRLNPEHPPLLKALAALPLSWMDLKFPTDSKAWTTDVNGQWDMGREFLYGSGNDPDLIVHASRVFPILLTLLLSLIIFLWSRELFGNLWALAPTALFALSPNVLAHGHYVTTDVAAAFGAVLATYAFLKFLARPTGGRLFWAGAALGVAELGKFSAVLLLPVFVVILLAHFAVLLRHRRREGLPPQGQWFKLALREGFRFAGVCLVAYLLVVYPMYFLLTRNYPMERQASDTETILMSYGHGPTPAGYTCQISRCLADLNIWMARHEATRPMAEYMLGVLMVTQRAAGGNTAYFLGHVTNIGSRLYFPAVFALKEPLPVLIMILAAAWLGICAVRRKVRGGWRYAWANFLDYLERDLTHFAMFFFVLFYWFYSMKSPLNIGFRHLFPTLPFIYMLTVGAWRKWILRFNPHYDARPLALVWYWMKEIMGGLAKYSVLIILIFWFLIETLSASPYYLSYFNELAGGPLGGYRYVTDSNYDWGQDMLRLRDFMNQHPEIDRLAIDFFGGATPQYYLGNKAENWWSAKGNPANQGIHWFAISANSIQGAIHPTTDFYERPQRDEYSWLTAIRANEGGLGGVPQPDYRVGTTIFIYHL